MSVTRRRSWGFLQIFQISWRFLQKPVSSAKDRRTRKGLRSWQTLQVFQISWLLLQEKVGELQEKLGGLQKKLVFLQIQPRNTLIFITFENAIYNRYTR